MAQRLFIAVPVTAEVRAAAAEAIAALKGTGADFRWVDPGTLHLTLCFLGNTPPDRVPEIKAGVDRAAARAPFDIVWGGLGAFPDAAHPRVVWLGVSEGLEPLRALAACWPQPEGQAWTPHLTLGRRKGPAKAAALQRALAARPPLGLRQRVERVVLYESKLTPEGPIHAELHSRELAP